MTAKTETTLRSRLLELEPLARRLELSGAEFHKLSLTALDILAPFVDEAPRLPGVARNSEENRANHAVARLIAQQLDGGLETASGNYLGYVPGGGLPTGAIGDLVAAVTNRFSGYVFAAPGAAKMENDIVRWLIQFFGLGERAWGTLTSGGTLANLQCLMAVRESWNVSNIVTSKPGRNVALEKRSIYLTNQAHHAVGRSLRVLGMHRCAVRVVPTDPKLRMNLSALREMIATDISEGYTPSLLIGSAGTTNTGAIDPLAELAEIAREHRSWFHVDAAYGGFFVLCEEGRRALTGIEQADSLVVDPHKGMFLAYGVGAALVRDGEGLRRAFLDDAPYLTHDDTDEPSPADYSIELTRHNRAPRIWLSLEILGREAFVAATEEKLLLARWLYGRLAQCPTIQVLEEPQLSVVAFRAHSDDETERLLKWIHDGAGPFVSSTRIDGQLWIRACILSFRTHLEQVSALVDRVAGWRTW